MEEPDDLDELAWTSEASEHCMTKGPPYRWNQTLGEVDEDGVEVEVLLSEFLLNLPHCLNLS